MNWRRLRVLLRRGGAMHTYRHLRRTQQLSRIRRVRAALVTTSLDAVDARPWFHGAAAPAAELATRQFLLARTAGRAFNRSLLGALGNGSPVAYPLPRAWQDIIATQGFAVSRWRCTIGWAGTVSLFWLYGVARIGGWVARDAWPLDKGRPPSGEPYAYFHRLSGRNLPNPLADGRSHDVVSWYLAWPGRADVTGVRHDVYGATPSTCEARRVEPAIDAIPPLDGGSLLRFAGWSLAAICSSAWAALRGRWPQAMLLAEAAAARRAALTPAALLARDYLFHNSGQYYRPLWTYETAVKGSRVLYYFYSLSEQFKLPGGYEDERDDWGAMNWPLYLVWDEEQAAFVRRAVGAAARIEVVGPIAFTTSRLEMSELPERAVAVFDIQPHRDTVHFGFSTMWDLYPNYGRVACRFLLDIEAAVAEVGGVMAHKRKRTMRNWLFTPYERLVQKMADSGRVIAVDPDTAAERVIERCAAVVSAPFTSTAVVARALGKPSAYYDPKSVIDPADRGAHGIPVLRGMAELRNWLRVALDDRGDARARLARAGGARG